MFPAFSGPSWRRRSSGVASQRSAGASKSSRRGLLGRSLRFEPLESRQMLSVGVGGGVWHDPKIVAPVAAAEVAVPAVQTVAPLTTGTVVISSVVTAGLGPVQNGTLDSNEAMVVTWAIQTTGVITTENIKMFMLDGVEVKTVYGPYPSGSSQLFAGVVGPLAVGTHTYTIHATSSDLGTATWYGSFNVVAGQLTVSSVVVAKAADGSDLTSSDPLVVTWAATDNQTVKNGGLQIDSRAVAGITYGPYSSGTAGTTYWAYAFGPIDSGTHTYNIIATDLDGLTGQSSGSMTVGQQLISGVVVAEANGPRDGVFTTNDQLVISWAVPNSTMVYSGSLTVDGVAVAQIYGPYGPIGGPNYYSGLFGPQLLVGTHTFTIDVVNRVIQPGKPDQPGVSSKYTGTFSVVAPPGLLAAPTSASKSNATLLALDKSLTDWSPPLENGFTLDDSGKTPG